MRFFSPRLEVPFHHHSLEDLEHVTPAQATKHPIWSMGRKISVDSATLMNKGLELIEAHILFNLPADKLNILVHPQSIIHAILTLQDGSMVAHLATPSMLIPLHHTLYWQERKPNSYWQERKPNSPQGESFLSPRSPTSPTSPTSPIMSPMMSPIVSPMMPPIVSPMMSPNIKAVKTTFS